MHVSGTYLDTTQSFDCILFASWRLQRQRVLHMLSKREDGVEAVIYTGKVSRQLLLENTDAEELLGRM